MYFADRLRFIQMIPFKLNKENNFEREYGTINVVYFDQLSGAAHPKASRNMRFLHANAIFSLSYHVFASFWVKTGEKGII